MNAVKGDWVEIHRTILNPEERASNIPDDTKKVPLELRTKGFLINDAKVGDEVEVETVTGRKVKGKLIEITPDFKHHFGRPINELIQVGLEVKKALWKGDN